MCERERVREGGNETQDIEKKEAQKYSRPSQQSKPKREDGKFVVYGYLLCTRFVHLSSRNHQYENEASHVFCSNVTAHTLLPKSVSFFCLFI